MAAVVGRPDSHSGEVPVAYVEVGENTDINEESIFRSVYVLNISNVRLESCKPEPETVTQDCAYKDFLEFLSDAQRK